MAVWMRFAWIVKLGHLKVVSLELVELPEEICDATTVDTLKLPCNRLTYRRAGCSCGLWMRDARQRPE